MFYKNSASFEEAIFGSSSSGSELVARFRDLGSNFSADVTNLLQSSEEECPDTAIGRSLFSNVKGEIERYELSADGLIFASAIDTKVDAHHFMDGVIYLPAVPRFPVTLDVMNLYETNFLLLRDRWIDSYEEQSYTEKELQSDLFQFKSGLLVWKKETKAPILFESLISQIDPRQYTKCRRPENHFILTPHHVRSYRERRAFAKFVAGYLAEKAGAGPRRPLNRP